MSTHNICFCGEIRKLSFLFLIVKCALSGDMLLIIPLTDSIGTDLIAQIMLAYTHRPLFPHPDSFHLHSSRLK